MNVRGYGLEDPHMRPINEFSVDEEYVTYMYTPYYDYEFTVWVTVAQKSDNNVILHTKPKDHKCKSVLIGENEDTALIEEESYKVEILGFVPIKKSEDMFIFTGEKQESEESEVQIYSRERRMKFSKSCNICEIHIDTMTTDVRLNLDLYEPHYGLKTVSGSDKVKVKKFDTEQNVWLELVSNLESFSAYSIEIDSMIKEIKYLGD